MNLPTLDPRRRVLRASAALLAGPALSALARAQTDTPAQTKTQTQPQAATRNAGEPIRLAQWLDASPDQQEISRDYATGVRLAVTDFNRNAKRRVQLVDQPCDGTSAGVEAAVRALRQDASVCALIGTAGEPLAISSIDATRQQGISIAHLAPWLHDTRYDDDRGVVSVFASRQTQIAFALKNVSSLGIVEIGLVYSNEREFEALHAGVEAAAKALGLRSVDYRARRGEDALALAGRLPGTSPALLLFLGQTIELSQFAQGLSARKLQRYVVSLADIDAGTLAQLGTGRSVPMILTQVVPNPQSSSLPAVRDYRASLKAQFDEKPSPISLAGYVAARYVLQVLAKMDRPVTRDSVLAEFARRPAGDVGGFQFGFSASQRRGSSYVTQTLLTGDGRMVG